MEMEGAKGKGTREMAEQVPHLSKGKKKKPTFDPTRIAKRS